MNSAEKNSDFEPITEWGALDENSGWDSLEELADQWNDGIESEPIEIHIFNQEPDEETREDFDRSAKFYARDAKPGEKTAGALEDMYFIYGNLGPNSANTVKTLFEADTEKIEHLKNDMMDFSHFFDDLSPKEKEGCILDNIVVDYINNYDPKIMTEDFKRDMFARIREVANREYAGYNDAQEISHAIIVANRSGNGKYFSEYFDFYNELENAPDNEFGDDSYNGRKLCSKSSVFRDFCTNHGMDDDTIPGFKENVFPMIDARDSEIDTLLTASNSWGTEPGDYGISDFKVKALVSRINPRNTRDLMQIERTIPTGDFAKFEQNRRDAIALVGILWEGREFIHNECPGINEIFTAMIDMYDANKSGDTEEYKRTREILEDLIAENDSQTKPKWPGFDGKLALNIENYDQRVVREVNNSGVEKYDSPAIEILRRLKNNTELSLLEKPKTNNPELDKMFDDFYIRIDQNEKKAEVDFKETGALVKKMNEFLVNEQGDLGLKPSMVNALMFTEKVATYAMRGVDGKEYRELGFDENFKEIVRFSELTASNRAYNEAEFEKFWNSFVSDFSKGWESEQPNYHRLTMRLTENVAGLAADYKKEGKPEYMIDSLWSGNLVHELVGLSDPR